MTAKELIERLQTLPEDARVVLPSKDPSRFRMRVSDPHSLLKFYARKNPAPKFFSYDVSTHPLGDVKEPVYCLLP